MIECTNLRVNGQSNSWQRVLNSKIMGQIISHLLCNRQAISVPASNCPVSAASNTRTSFRFLKTYILTYACRCTVSSLQVLVTNFIFAFHLSHPLSLLQFIILIMFSNGHKEGVLICTETHPASFSSSSVGTEYSFTEGKATRAER